MPSDLAVIIDDSATSRKILERLTASLGNVFARSFANAETALSFCRQCRPGLVVVGEPAGGNPAAEFIRNLQAYAGNVPVLVVAAAEDRDAIESARQAGAGDHVIAPVDHRDFLLRARDLLLRRGTRSADSPAEAASERAMQGPSEPQPDAAARITTEFLYNMSHELRTPLNAIIGFSQVIAGEMLGPVGTPRYAGYARDILDSAERLLGIVNDFLDVARLETGTLELSEEIVDPYGMIADLVRLLEVRAEAASVRVLVSQEGALPALRADRCKLRQVLLNLLTNAIKFSKQGGAVEVVLRNVGGAVVIDVKDHGIGMEPQEVELAMTRFGQVATPWARKHDGTGLGLPLAIGLVELHGATLTIRSAKDVGTTVTVAFPPERSETAVGERIAVSAASSV